MPTSFQLDRRTMLISSGLLLTTMTQGGIALANPAADDDLQLLTENPRNGGPDLEALVANWITPNRMFYVRSHAPNPEIDPDQFRLQVDGLVERPLQKSLLQLKQLPKHSVTATLTCAGNRRTEFNAVRKVGGVQWGSNAIGNAVWTGVSLRDLLREVRPQTTASHVCFEGLDAIAHDDSTIPFGASIPIQKVMNDRNFPGAILAYEMNGEPLPIDHGFPLRALVPGYIGARSVKWLGKITLSDQPSKNHYMSSAYKVVRDQSALDWEEAGPIYRYPINAAVAAEGTIELRPGKVSLQGYVLPSGVIGARVESVELSADGGDTWTKARLTGEDQDYCWRLWNAELHVTSSTKEIIVRASDTKGSFMPQQVEWNAKGYLQNAWFRQSVSVQ